MHTTCFIFLDSSHWKYFHGIHKFPILRQKYHQKKENFSKPPPPSHFQIDFTDQNRPSPDENPPVPLPRLDHTSHPTGGPHGGHPTTSTFAACSLQAHGGTKSCIIDRLGGGGCRRAPSTLVGLQGRSLRAPVDRWARTGGAEVTPPFHSFGGLASEAPAIDICTF